MRKKTQEQFVGDVKRILGEDFEVAGIYTSAKENVKFKHLSCDREFESTPTNILSRKRCPLCARELVSINQRKSHEQYVADVEKVHGGDYVVLEEYVKAVQPVKVLHVACGVESSIIPRNLLSGQGCPKCYGNIKKSDIEFRKQICELTKGDYEPLSEYSATRHKIKMIHKTCGHEYEVTPNDFLNGNRCPNCKMESRGSLYIKETLNSIGIPFITEYRISGCMHKRTLPFDFAIMKEGKVSLLIEYDGEQHYFSKKRFGDIKDIHFRDFIKDTYCYDNGMPLLRIPYWLSKEEIKWELLDSLISADLMVDISNNYLNKSIA